MVSIASDALNALRRAHAERPGGVDLVAFLARFKDLGDDELADIIELDGRERLRAGMTVDLARYISAIPNLADRRVALDAAIEFALRSLSGSRHTTPEAVETLCKAYPDLVEEITAAWFLNDALGSTAGAADPSVAPVKELSLPMCIGPMVRGERGERRRYELRQRVGVGSHGAVYLAVDDALSEPDRPAWVAIKITTLVRGSDAMAVRVVEEATKARRVSHPNIARVLDRGTMEGQGEYVVYEHVAGGDLQDAFDRGKTPENPRDLVRLVSKVARAVQAAHSAGLIHSDLKPGNILLTEEGEPKVADFGLAARRFEMDAAAGHLLGTLGFMAPERYRAEPGSECVLSDVYSLGGILAYLLTGRAPNGTTPDEVADRLGADPSRTPPLELIGRHGPLDEDLEAICRRALSPDPRGRYASADAFANDLDAWLEHRPLAWRRPEARRAAKLFVQRHPVLGTSAGVLLVAAIVMTALVVQTQAAARQQKLRSSLDAERSLSESQATAQRQVIFAVSTAMATMKKDLRMDMGEEWLAFLSVIESVAGPVLFDLNGSSSVETLWTSRIETSRRMVAEAERNGRAGDLETLLWRLAQGYWLHRSAKDAEALLVLTRAAEELKAKLGPDDSFTIQAQVLRACTVVSHVVRQTKGSALTDQDRADLEEARQTLVGQMALFTGERRGTSVHRHVVETLVAINGPGLLNNSSEYANYAEELRRINLP